MKILKFMISHEPVITKAILRTASKRGILRTTCPSEIARELFPDDWRNHMQEIRDAAIELHNSGQVTITQGGSSIGDKPIKGPIRIRINKP